MKGAQQTVLCEQAMDPRFLDEVYGIPGGEKIKDCIGCGTCSGSCPVSWAMKETPRRLFAMIRAGIRNKVLESLPMWTCASCYQCAEHCPRQGEADCIAAACPICQLNHDAHQARINKNYRMDFDLPIVFFTQLMGLAFTLKSEDLGLKRCIVPVNDAMARFAKETQ